VIRAPAARLTREPLPTVHALVAGPPNSDGKPAGKSNHMTTPTQRAILAEEPVAFPFRDRIFYGAGTTLTETHLHAAYLADDGKVKSAHGQVIGSYRVTSSWPTPGSWIATRRCHVRAIVHGRTYHGQSWGKGMVFNGRRLVAELRGIGA
jgi:hypothetical protein